MNLYPDRTIGRRHTSAQIEAREGAIQRQIRQRQKAMQRGDAGAVARWDERIAVLKKGRHRDA